MHNRGRAYSRRTKRGRMNVISKSSRYRRASAYSFGETLRILMYRPTYDVTPGLLAKLSGVPKGTIVNWLDGRVASPRSSNVIDDVCNALRLSDDEARLLYTSAAFQPPPPLPTIAPTFDGAPIGLYSTTLDGRVLSANATLIAMLGYDRRSYYALDVAQDLYFDSHERSRWLAKIQLADSLERTPLIARHACGAPLSLLDSCTAIRDRTGRIVRFDGIWQHVTPHR